MAPSPGRAKMTGCDLRHPRWSVAGPAPVRSRWDRARRAWLIQRWQRSASRRFP